MTLRSRRANELAGQHLDHARPGQPHQVGQLRQREGEHRQHQGFRARGAAVSRRKPAQADREQQHEQRRHHENRHGDTSGRQRGYQPIGQATAAQRREDTGWNADQQSQNHRQCPKQHRQRQLVADQLRHAVSGIAVRGTEIAVQQATQVAEQLLA